MGHPEGGLFMVMVPPLTWPLLVSAPLVIAVGRTLWRGGSRRLDRAGKPGKAHERADHRQSDRRSRLNHYLRKAGREVRRGLRLREGARDDAVGPTLRWHDRPDHSAAQSHLRVGERVRVRSVDEIRSTLDPEGGLDSLPFMPEMASYCGQEFRVYKRFEKYNDYVYRTGLRRVTHAVLLEGVRCDGTSHGGCQALCQIVWKEAWLTRVEEQRSQRPNSLGTSPSARLGHSEPPQDAVSRVRGADVGDELRFSCQATELYKASSRLPWWDVRQYWRDLSSGNVSATELVGGVAFSLFSLVVRLVVARVGGYRLLVGLYDRVQRMRGADPYPYRQGRLTQTPTCELHLKPGERVRVKSYDAIVKTLNTNNKNRGLWFDAEMVKYCGGTYAVLGRVETLIDDKSGRVIKLQNPCIVLDGVTNQGNYHRFNARNEYLFWREIWLERVPEGLSGDSPLKV